MTDLLRSTLLASYGVEHGFNLRSGGASLGPYQASNLGRRVGDDPAHVEANHIHFADAVGYPRGRLYETEQVHGCAVRLVQASDSVQGVRTCHADAVATLQPGLAIGVRVADCLPLLLFDARSGAVAAVHAGWRGVCEGVVEAGLGALMQLGGSGAGEVAAAIFPHIARCCFEVGEDVAQSLLAVSPDSNVVERSRSRPRPHVDLRALVRAKLVAHGVAAARIDAVAGCTRCDPQRFFSFRRDGQRSGRHVAAIVAPARSA